VGSVARGLKVQTTVGWSEPVIFVNFGRHIFGAVKVEANSIMQRHEVPYRLSSDLKTLDVEMPFYTDIQAATALRAVTA